MNTTLNEYSGTVSPSPADTQLAQESSRKLTRLLGAKKQKMRLHVQSDNKPEETIEVPASVVHLLANILTEMAQGNAVTLMPIHSELTTQEAAELLKVSRPFLIEQLEKGMMPYRMVGSHRRILFQDLMAYKQKTADVRSKALEQLSALDQELRLGY